MGFFGAQMGSNAPPHLFGVARDPFRPDAAKRSGFNWVFEVCKTHTSKPVTPDLSGSGLPGAQRVGGRSRVMGDDTYKISSPNSPKCARNARNYFAKCEKNALGRTFFGVFDQKKSVHGTKLAQEWWFTQVGEPRLQSARGEGRDLVRSTRSLKN